LEKGIVVQFSINNGGPISCFLLQTDFEKDVDIACRSGKNTVRVFRQQKEVLYQFLVK